VIGEPRSLADIDDRHANLTIALAEAEGSGELELSDHYRRELANLRSLRDLFEPRTKT